jgi:hypothetical protein
VTVFIEYEIFFCTVGYVVSLEMTIVLCEMLKKCCVFREWCEFTGICVCMYVRITCSVFDLKYC